MLRTASAPAPALVLALVALLAPLSAAVASAATISLTPTADAFVSAANPANNYGAAGALSLSSPGFANGQFDSVMRFDTASAKTAFDAQYGAGHWFVWSVTLRLTSTAPNNAIFNPSAPGSFFLSWMQNDSWVEGTGTPTAPTTTGITFNSLPSFLGPNDAPLGIYNFPGGTSGSNSYTLGLTAGLFNDIQAGSLVSMHAYFADSGVSYLFNSRNFGTASARPELTITAIPEPATAALLLLACALKRRR